LPPSLDGIRRWRWRCRSAKELPPPWRPAGSSSTPRPGDAIALDRLEANHPRDPGERAFRHPPVGLPAPLGSTARVRRSRIGGYNERRAWWGDAWGSSIG
jgi:hypothetical protein